MTVQRTTTLGLAGNLRDGMPQFAPGALLLGRYRLAAPIGRGGMGIVYRADDLKLGQRVALKFLSPQLEHDPERVAQLVAEVRLGRRVAHPNVCRLYDIAEFGSRHFIVMELVEGEDLGSLLERIGRLPQEKALGVARDVCAGLAAAHDQGIIHRDLKPGNVMIDSRGRARITDFGIASSVDDLPQRHVVMGTLGYMAPEQARGQQPTPATDVYALGVLLYEILTGHPPFQVTSIFALANTPPIPPSNFVPDLDPRIETLILRCLSHDAADRPSSARAVLDALPQSDILDAALEAGETPSPEVVAAAGTIGRIPPLVAWTLLLTTIACTAL
ncbi:MAG TPA: serine/threonine-protein kinase, partial [Thermoanaerobaculia bacterium]|nr:serine/threonine-protein kinase [Thermoanaerobaculia bacterium]